MQKVTIPLLVGTVVFVGCFVITYQSLVVREEQTPFVPVIHTSSSSEVLASSAPQTSTLISVVQTPAPASPVVVTPTPSTPPVSNPSSPAPGEIRFEAYVTGYSYWDNTPPGSSAISNGVVHDEASGIGTYADPITLAVGHSIINGKDILDYPPGTRFYFPYLKKYVMVEDTCGDGDTPQDGPCHSGYEGHPWLDLYVDGKDVSRSASTNCMNSITDVHTVIQNPALTYAVVAGSLSETGCEIF